MLTNFKPVSSPPAEGIQDLGDLRFYGMDARHRSDAAAPGTCQMAENFGIEQGSLLSRTGLQGQLTALMGGAIYEPTEYRNGASGTVRIIFAAKELGNTDGFGRLWRMENVARRMI